MALGEIEIVEFVGAVEDSNQDEVSTYLLGIDGDARKKYGNYQFEYLPKEWRDDYQIASFHVGEAPTWKKFYTRCGKAYVEVLPFGNTFENPSEPRDLSHLFGDGDGDGLKSSDDAGPDLADVEPEIRKSDEASDSLEESSVTVADEPQADSGHPALENLAMASSIRGIFEDLLERPPEEPDVLRFEVEGYLALLRDEEQQSGTINVELAENIAEHAKTLLEREEVSSPGEENTDYRLVQAAIRYFTVSEDATPDFREGGLQDDLAVLNAVARETDHEDLIIEDTV